MAWELFAIWAIVIVTTTWFVRDEKRRKADAGIERAAHYYAYASEYRHVSPEPVRPEAPQRRVGGLSDQQRAFLKALQHA